MDAKNLTKYLSVENKNRCTTLDVNKYPHGLDHSHFRRRENCFSKTSGFRDTEGREP